MINKINLHLEDPYSILKLVKSKSIGEITINIIFLYSVS